MANNSKAKVFLAEDDVSLGFVIKDNLEEEGYEVVHCSDGQTAMERFNKDEFDICLQELMMRMNVFLRRTKKLHSETQEEYQIGNLRFSFTDLKLYSPEGSFSLTQREADLLRFLCRHPNKVLKREEVLMNVWGKDDYFLGRSMDVFMTKLRKYFKEDPAINLETIHGLGFRFNASVTQ